MNATDNSNLHRYLDDTFAGIAMTPEVQDLKEEIRGNLAARVAELTAGGLDQGEAATKAVDELGDIHELVEQLDADGSNRTASRSASNPYLVYRVRPRPAFVVGTVIASLAIATALLLATLGATGVLQLPTGAVIGLAGIVASGTGWIVGDSLAHETTTNHPMPAKRAGSYFFASLLAVYGLEFAGLVTLGALPLWMIAFAAIGVVAAIVLFAFLGATQTNRKKAWAHAAAREYQIEDRFSQDPVAAARFGIYTVVIWLLAFAAFAVLSAAVGFTWSWLALLAGLAVFFLTLARMLFPSHDDTARKDR